jgi:guanylate kinase
VEHKVRLVEHKMRLVGRDAAKPIRDRFSRHYSDLAAMSTHAETASALANDELRQRVADWKSRFFAAHWARYDLAKTRNVPSCATRISNG